MDNGADLPLTDPEALVARIIAGEDKQHALQQISVLFNKDRDFRFLLGAARLLPHFEPYLTYHQDAQWRILAFCAAGNEADRAALRNRIIYEEVAPSYLRVVRNLLAGARFPQALPRFAPKQRLLIVEHGIKGGDHSPTMVAFEYGLALERLYGIEVMILDVRTYPGDQESDLAGIIWVPIQRPTGMKRLGLNDRDTLLTYTAKTQGITAEKIVECMQVALQFNPDWVLSHGYFNLIGDLLAQRFPTVCMELTRMEPVSLAQSFVMFEDIVKELRLPAMGLLPRAPKVYRLCSHIPLRDKRVTYARAKYGLSPEQIVYAVIGFRLPLEITDEFETAMARILDAVPNSVILIVGSRRVFRNERLKAMPDRLPFIQYEPELRSLLALCDCYLNPPRQGGGGSALMALLEHVPILTLAENDVAGVVGPEHTLPDLDALTARAIALGLDPAARQAARDESEAILARVPRFEDSVADLWRALVETREDFLVESATGAVVSD